SSILYRPPGRIHLAAIPPYTGLSQMSLPDRRRIPRAALPLLAAVAASLQLTAPLPLAAQQAPAAARAGGTAMAVDSALLAGLSWRSLGPDRGGRSIAASGVRGRPAEAYFGAAGGGLWKTTDG